MPHATLAKFGYPESVVHAYEHWCVLLRPGQLTLGSLVLVSISEDTAFGDLSAAAFAEMKTAIGDIEATLKSLFAYDRINYLMLMMVDPQVHCHVLPRYAEERRFEGQDFADRFWPKPADLSAPPLELGTERHAALLAALRQAWPAA